jgi:hypothetical protein
MLNMVYQARLAASQFPEFALPIESLVVIRSDAAFFYNRAGVAVSGFHIEL